MSTLEASPEVPRAAATELPGVAKACGAQHCVGCPAAARGLLEGLLGESAEACGFDSLAIEPRSPLPPAWLSRYSFAMVRRGYLIRQRTDAAGRTTAIDAVGPGCCFPLDKGDGNISGYALTRALVCLSDEDTLRRGLLEGGPSAADVHQLDSEAIVRLERLADARGRPGAAGKVAALLCTLADTLRANGQPAATRIPLEFLQRDLAALLSIRHESVCRVMRDFTKRGLVAREPEGLRLADREALQAL
jgi:CRP-like cAMP-binding protein